MSLVIDKEKVQNKTMDKGLKSKYRVNQHLN